MDGRRAAVDGDDEKSVPGRFIKDVAAAFDGAAVYVDVAFAVQGDEPPRLQGIVFAPQGRQPFHPAQEAHIFMAPGIGTAVVRILPPGEAGFVAIVDTRCSRHGHLPGHEQFHPAHGNGFAAHVTVVALADREDPFDVVAADEVEHGIPVFRRVVLHELHELPTQTAAVFLAQHEGHGHGAEDIIHGTVYVVAAEVFPLLAVGDLIGSIFPDFADEDGIGIFFFERMIEAAQERHGQFVDDVEAPAADALVQPVFEDAVFTTDDEIHVGRRRFFYVGQVFDAPPRFIVVGIVREPVPFIVRRFFGLIGTQGRIMAEAVEIDAVGASMAEYAIEDDADAPSARLFAQGRKFVIGPQEGVDAMVVAGAIAVVAAAFKDRVEIDGRDAQVGEVIELLPNAGQVAAKEIVLDHIACFRILAIIGAVVPGAVDDGAGLSRQVLPVHAATAEAVGKNLVDDGVFEPVRRMGVFVVDCNLERRRHRVIEGTHAAEVILVVAVVQAFPVPFDDEIIPQKAARLGQLPRRGKGIPLGGHGDEGFPGIALPEPYRGLAGFCQPAAD